MHISESDTWRYLFNTVRIKYFEQWSDSLSVEQREQIFKKLSTLSDIEKELMEIKAQSIFSHDEAELMEI